MKKIFFLIFSFAIILIIFQTGQFNNLSLRISNKQNLSIVPEIFRENLWRETEFWNSSNNRYVLQEKWAIDVAQSKYLKNVKRKKRILTLGNFNLDSEEKLLPCNKDRINFSQFCELVEDFSWVPNYRDYEQFDAVLIRRDWTYQFYEPRIPPNLYTFFSIMESPYTLHQGDFRVNNPILASYWRDSSRNYADGRRRLVAIVVSHCPTYNDRLAYVQKLAEFLPVHIYGACGTFPCVGNCFKDISTNYKFYLAFENANCRDYITEKFFRSALMNDLVPIVLGAHPLDYKAAAPPNSYIHVEDFNSPQELAAYLLYLDANDEEYNQYFKWKGTGEIVSGHSDLFCRVCAFLYYADFHKPKIWPKDSYSWLNVNHCLKPFKHFWRNEI